VEPVLPLFNVGVGPDDIDVAVFPSLEEAKGFMEPPEVLDHTDDLYDALARRARPEVRGSNVGITGFEPIPEEQSFKERVARLLAAIGHPIDPDRVPMTEFTRYAYRVISDWQRRWKR